MTEKLPCAVWEGASGLVAVIVYCVWPRLALSAIENSRVVVSLPAGTVVPPVSVTPVGRPVALRVIASPAPLTRSTVTGTLTVSPS